MGGWGPRGEGGEVSGGEFPGGRGRCQQTRTLEALEKESWGVFQ